jgi:hypothetical protein
MRAGAGTQVPMQPAAPSRMRSPGARRGTALHSPTIAGATRDRLGRLPTDP